MKNSKHLNVGLNDAERSLFIKCVGKCSCFEFSKDLSRLIEKFDSFQTLPIQRSDLTSEKCKTN